MGVHTVAIRDRFSNAAAVQTVQIRWPPAFEGSLAGRQTPTRSTNGLGSSADHDASQFVGNSEQPRRTSEQAAFHSGQDRSRASRKAVPTPTPSSFATARHEAPECLKSAI